jgi:hypothetical protein
MHGAPIAIVAVTEDGGAAATSDTAGMIRLWPTLDGSHEPFVVAGPSPARLAVARDRDHGFSSAAVDEAGTMTVMVVGADGRLREHTQVDDDQQILQIEATPQGFLALRGDQSIELVTLRGKRWALLAPGERVAALLYRNDRALALFGSAGAIHGRWIELVAGARWGKDTPELAIDLPEHAVLAPDHAHVVAIAHGKLVAVDVATGVASAPFPGRGDPLGYTEDGTIACSDRGGLVYWSETGKRIAHVSLSVAPDDVPSAVANGRVVMAMSRSLALLDQKRAQYLGYQIDVPTQIRAASEGRIVLGGNHRHWVVDGAFRLARLLHVPHDEYTEVLDAVPVTDTITVALEEVDETRWVTSIGGGDLYMGVRDAAVHFDPKTRLLVEALSGQSILIRVGEDGTFGAAMTLHTSTSPLAQYLVDTTEDPDRVFLLDPDLSGGFVVAVVHGHRLYELHRDDLDSKRLEARVSTKFTGTLVTIDRAGRQYLRRPGSKDLVVVDGDREVVLAGSEDAKRVVPSPDGTLIATQGTRLSLYSADRTAPAPAGDVTPKWTVPALGMTGIAWEGGSLVAAAQGVVRIELATGKLGDRQCGWRFGLFAKPLADGGEQRLVCDA